MKKSADVLYNSICFFLMFHWYCILNADVDECIGEVYPCDPNASCNNSISSFSCTCLTGYSGNGMTCTGKLYVLSDIYWMDVSLPIVFVDFNECLNNLDNNCDSVNGYCINTIGSYNCNCSLGYAGDGVMCIGLCLLAQTLCMSLVVCLYRRR